MSGHDGQEARAAQGRKLPLCEGARDKANLVCRGRPVDVRGEVRRLVLGQPIKQLRYLGGDAGPHEHVVHAGEHRAVGSAGRRHLDLLEEVDPDEAVVAFLGKPDLGEVGHHGELHRRGVRIQAQLGHGRVGLVQRPPARAKVPPEGPLGHLRHREVLERSSDVTTLVAILQPAGDDHVERGTRNHPQLPSLSDFAGQLPGRDRDPHAPLDDDWQRTLD